MPASVTTDVLGNLLAKLSADAKRGETVAAQYVRALKEEVVKAELGPHGRADEIQAKTAALDRYREIRELLEAASQQIDEARGLTDD